MQTIIRGGMLATLAVLAIFAGISEGAVLSKCEVKRHMREVFDKLPQAVLLRMDEEAIIAKIVCHIELASGFNTSAVNQLTVPMDSSDKRNGGRRGRRSPGAGGSRFELAKFMGSRSSEEGSGSSSSSSSSEEAAEERGDVWTLYGIFQMSDRVMCDSGSVPSLNLCETDCSAFIDDDITDDIACGEKLQMKMMSSPGQHAEAMALLKRMMALMFQPECRTVTYQEYFATCQ